MILTNLAAYIITTLIIIILIRAAINAVSRFYRYATEEVIDDDWEHVAREEVYQAGLKNLGR